MAILLIASTLGLLIFFTASGVPPIISVIMVGMALVSYTYLAKLGNTFWVHTVDFFQHGGQMWWWYPGAQLGYWPNPPNIATQTQAAFATDSLGYSFNYMWNTRSGTFGPSGTTSFYKIAYESKTNLKHILIAGSLLFIVGIPICMVSFLFFISHAGGVPRTGSWGTWIGAHKYTAGFTRALSGIVGATTYEVSLPWQVIGMIMISIVYIMRMKFTWFWIDPGAFTIALPHAAWYWGVALIALVIRLILIRIIGATRFRQYARDFGSGLVIGYASIMIILWITELTTVMIPRFQSQYIP